MQQNCRYEINQLSNVVFFFSLDSGIEFLEEQRTLTDFQLSQLRLQDERPCDAFRAEKFQRESGKHWDLFYKRNETRFFKDRHWTTREFSELIAGEEGAKDTSKDRDQDHPQKILFEIGCGVGNFLFPLIEEQSNLFVHACDISPRAIQMVKDNSLYKESLVNAFQCDITQDCCFGERIESESVDIASLIFVLSSIRPQHFSTVLKNIHKVCSNLLVIYFDTSKLYSFHIEGAKTKWLTHLP